MLRRVTVLIVALLLALATTGNVVADAPEEQANCVAVLTSHLGNVDAAVHFLQAAAAAQGIPFGQLAQSVAHQHGTLEECLALVTP